MKLPGLIVRAAACVALSLGLWWFLFRPASVFVLRRLVYVPLALLITPPGLSPVAVSPQTGEWVFNVAVNYDGVDPQSGRPRHVESIEFAAEPGTAEDFTAGWFTYLGLTLAVGGFAKSRRLASLKGFGFQLAASVLAVVLFAYVSAISAVADAGALRQFLRVAEYVLGGVIPLAGPFAVSLCVHSEWRGFFHS